MENSSNILNDETENNEVIQNLIKQGKYDEVVKYLNSKPLEIDNNNEEKADFESLEQELLPADDISLSSKPPELSESQQSILLNPYENGYEELLNEGEISKEGGNKNSNEKEEKNNDENLKFNFYNFEEKNNENAKNLELLTKELEELEQYEKEDKNNIETMNEMYQMIQEDQLSKKLQIETRLKLFPNLNKANIKLSEELKSELFTNIQMLRQCHLSSVLIQPNNNQTNNEINKKYLLEIPDSIFDSLEYSIQDLKSKIDYDEVLMEYTKDNSQPKKTMSELFRNYQDIINKKREKKKVVVINIESKNYHNYIESKQSIPALIINKVKSWIKTDNLNPNSSHNNSPDNISFKDFNHLFLRSFYSKEKSNPNPLLELTLINQNLKTIPIELIKDSPQLKFLNLEENQIEKISNLDSLTKLYSLNLNKNLIKKIENISKLENLEKLSLNYNLIEQIENCEQNFHLKILSIGKNKISSIESIENQVLYIEELILSENRIKFIPEKFSLPYLRFLDLNENKIKKLNEFLYCPCLEKLLLIGNKIEGDNIKPIFKYCTRLREIDLSFNKIEFLSFVLGILRKNENIEIINVSNNPFIMNGAKFCKLFLQKSFPKIKMINLENISPKDKNCVKLKIRNISKNSYQNIYLSKNYFSIFLLQSYFMKFFNSFYFTNKIHNLFNLNINSNLTNETSPLLDIANSNHFLFKQNHLKCLNLYFDKKILNFSNFSQFQNQILNYLYDFKHKMLYIKNSMGIFSKNLTLRKLKIEKIQRMWKMIILRKKLKDIKFVDEEKENCDDLIGFFNSEQKNDDIPTLDNKWEIEKIEEIEKNLMKLNQKPKHQDKPQKHQLLETINENENENEPIKNNVKESIEIEKKPINPSINNFFEDQQYLRKSINDLTKTKQLTPLKQTPAQPPLNSIKESNNFYQSNSEVANIINNLNPSIKSPSTPNTINSLSDLNLSKTRYYPQVPNKYKQGDNIHLKVVNMNNQMMLPPLKNYPNKKNVALRPESNIILPSIKNNMESFSVNNDDTKSVKSNFSVNSKFSTLKGRMLPQKTIDAIRKLEEECRMKIHKAKEEWQFNNQQTDELLAKKITKAYQKKINKLLANS